MKLLVIADDFTGALDTGVQFAEQGITTHILYQPDLTADQLREADGEVLVIDAETRHLNGDQAYKTVYSIVKAATENSVPYIYKKTDSGLRGNIGEELQAALDASGLQYLTFIPALPAMNRITVNGIHYIDKIPVRDSVFGADLFNPVPTSNVKDLFQQADCPVKVYRVGEQRIPGQTREIGIFDAKTQQDIVQIVTELQKKNTLGVMAGCTGFAAVLADHLNLSRRKVEIPFTAEKLFILCGSINDISRRQIEYAEQQGIRRVTMKPFQLAPRYLESEEGIQWLAWLKDYCSSGRTCVVETGISDPERVRAYMREKGISLEESRLMIADTMGLMLKRLLDMGLKAAVMVIGGDTLNGFFHQIQAREITICRELEPGTVLSYISYRGQRQWIISKSGGFGRSDLLVDLENNIKGGKEQNGTICDEDAQSSVQRIQCSEKYFRDCEGKIS